MTSKERVLEAVEKIPEDLPLDEYFERLRDFLRLRESLEQAKRGEGIPHKEVVEWLEKAPWRRRKK